MKRRHFVAQAGAWLAVPAVATAQTSGRSWRIGYLSLGSEGLDQYKPWMQAWREGLRGLGYVEGQNLVLEQRYAAGRVDRLPALAAELVALKVDVLVTWPAGAAAAARDATTTVPIVFIAEPDPVGTGLVASLGRPGGNVTGLADAHGDLIPKRVELLKQIVPSATRVGVLWNPSNRSTQQQVQAVEAAAATLGIQVAPIDVKGPAREDVEHAFAAVAKARLAALLVLGDSTLGVQRDRIASLAIAQRLPTSGSHSGWAEGGLLMSYGTDFVALFHRGASVVDRILKGARPADLPVEQPTKFELTFNRRTARSIDLALPEALLLRADRIIS